MRKRSPLYGWIYMWWILLPNWMNRVSYRASFSIVDGIYLNAWPLISALLSPFALLFGFLFGWRHLGFEVVFIESLLFVIIVAFVGSLSGHLGMMIVGGYMLGDLVWFLSMEEHQIGMFGSMLISYAVLVFLAVTIPVYTHYFIEGLIPSNLSRLSTRLAISIFGQAIISSILVWMWLIAVPILSRPIFIWSGRRDYVDLLQPLQHWGFLVIAVVLSASLIRNILRKITDIQTSEGPGAKLWVMRNLSCLRQTNRERLPLLLTSLKGGARALWVTLLLAGLYSSWWEAILFALFSVILQWMRVKIIPLPNLKGVSKLDQVPSFYRLVICFIMTAIITMGFQSDEISLHTVLFLVSFSMLIVSLSHPNSPESDVRVYSMGVTQVLNTFYETNLGNHLVFIVVSLSFFATVSAGLIPIDRDSNLE